MWPGSGSMCELRHQRAHQHGGQNVGRWRRHAEPEHDGQHRADHQGEELVGAGDRVDHMGELGGEPGHGEAGDHQAGGGGGARHRHHAVGGVGQRLPQLDRAEPGVGAGATTPRSRPWRRRSRPWSACSRRAAPPVSTTSGTKNMPPLFRVALQRSGSCAGSSPVRPKPQGAEMHLGVDADVIEDRRQERRDGDVAIFDAGIFGHDEGGRAHHRRHDAAAGRGRDLDRGRDGGAIAEPHHHRDRDRAGGHHVGGRAAGDHAVHARRDHRDLGRARRAAGPRSPRRNRRRSPRPWRHRARCRTARTGRHRSPPRAPAGP